MANEALDFDQAGVSAVAMIEGHMEAEILDYGDNPLVFVDHDRDDLIPSDSEPAITASNSESTKQSLSLADAQVCNASLVDYQENLLDFWDAPGPQATDQQMTESQD